MGEGIPTELDLARERFAFEREKWAAEERRRDAEQELRKEEQRRSSWRSPLVVAILAAAIAAIGNGVVALVNGQSQRELEASRAESGRILQMLDTGGDRSLAEANLKFLVEVGLVSDPETGDRLLKYFNTRKPGTGPSLTTGPVASVESSSQNLGQEIPQGSSVVFQVNSDSGVASGSLFAGEKIVASWESVELKSPVSELLSVPSKLVILQITFVFTKPGKANIDARILDPDGRELAAYTKSIEGAQGAVQRVNLHMITK